MWWRHVVHPQQMTVVLLFICLYFYNVSDAFLDSLFTNSNSKFSFHWIFGSRMRKFNFISWFVCEKLFLTPKICNVYASTSIANALGSIPPCSFVFWLWDFSFFYQIWAHEINLEWIVGPLPPSCYHWGFLAWNGWQWCFPQLDPMACIVNGNCLFVLQLSQVMFLKIMRKMQNVMFWVQVCWTSCIIQLLSSILGTSSVVYHSKILSHTKNGFSAKSKTRQAC